MSSDDLQKQIDEYKRIIEYYEQCFRNIKEEFEIEDSYFPQSIINTTNELRSFNTSPLTIAPNYMPYFYYCPTYPIIPPPKDAKSYTKLDEEDEEVEEVEEVDVEAEEVDEEEEEDIYDTPISNQCLTTMLEFSNSTHDESSGQTAKIITKQELNNVNLPENIKAKINRQVDTYINTIKKKNFEGHSSSIFFDKLVTFKTYVRTVCKNDKEYHKFRQQRRRISNRVAAFKKRLCDNYKFAFLMKDKIKNND